MARPRATDVLFFKSRGLYYQTLPDGKRIYLGKVKKEARKNWLEEQVKFRLQQHQDWPDVQHRFDSLVQNAPVEDCTWDDSTKTLSYHIPSAASKAEANKGLLFMFLDMVNLTQKVKPIVMGDDEPTKPTNSNGHDFRWAKRQYQKHTKAGEAQTKVLKAFTEFIKVAGNKPCLAVEAADFLHYREWCDEHKTSNDWYNKRLGRVGTLWRWLICEHEADVPHRLPMWLDSNKQQPHEVKDQSSAIVPPAEFYAAIAEADPVYKAVFLLCLGCGLNRSDVRLLKWSQLFLDDPIPHYAGKRHKLSHKIGAKTFRRIPLLPETVAALKALPGDGDYVFPSIKKDFYISSAWDKVSGGSMFSQLRNCFSTAAEEADVSDKLIDRFLGHSRSGDTKKYLDKMPVDHLMPVVEAGRQKFFAKED